MVMSPDELKRQLQQLVDGAHITQKAVGHGKWAEDVEVGHAEADGLLVKALRAAGYDEAMDIYEAQLRFFG